MSQGEPRLAGHGFRLDASSTQAFKAIGSLHLPNPLKGNVDPTELRYWWRHWRPYVDSHLAGFRG